jgi:hypothetical protein
MIDIDVNVRKRIVKNVLVKKKDVLVLLVMIKIVIEQLTLIKKLKWNVNVLYYTTTS